MKTATIGLLAAIACAGCACGLARDDGLGRKPLMGWNTWCTLSSCHQNNGNYSHDFHDVCNEWMVKDVAQSIIDQGMQAVGWEYINMDDCWEASTRAADGSIQADPDRFPSGIKSLADWLHARGFKFGIYVSAGYTTCSTGNRPVPYIPGSMDHYVQDAATLASWGVDMTKLDWCGANNLTQDVVTPQFTAALNKTGRPIWSNFHCDHTDGNVPQWCIDAGNSYRIAHDHHDNWDNTASVIETLKSLAPFGRPSHWNDPDFLMTGGAGCDINATAKRCPGQSETEYRTEMSLWSISASQLLVASDVRNMTDFMRRTLMNKEVIAINQDSLGIAGGLVHEWQCSGPAGVCQVWARPLSAANTFAAALYNADSRSHNITLPFTALPARSGSGWGASTRAVVRDVWQGADLGTFKGSFTASVASHETVLLTLRPPSTAPVAST